MTPSLSRWAQFGLCSWTWLREANGCPVPLQALNLLPESRLPILGLGRPVGLLAVNKLTKAQPKKFAYLKSLHGDLELFRQLCCAF